MKTVSACNCAEMIERQLGWVLVSVKTTNREKGICAKIPKRVCSAVAVKITGSNGLQGFLVQAKGKESSLQEDCFPVVEQIYFFITSPSRSCLS